MRNYKSKDIKVPKFNEANGFYTTAKRSKIMSKIRGKNTKPELNLRKALYKSGVRYRLHNRQLPGNPDIVNKTLGFVVFVDGEFWHGYNWVEKREKIKSNRAFWIPKIEKNLLRDQESNVALQKMGFKVFRFWEHEVQKECGVCVKLVLDYIASQK